MTNSKIENVPLVSENHEEPQMPDGKGGWAPARGQLSPGAIENVPLLPVGMQHVWDKSPFKEIALLRVGQSYVCHTRKKRETVSVVIHRAGKALKRRFGMRKEGKGFRIGRLQ
jgi:hypothetical protein